MLSADQQQSKNLFDYKKSFMFGFIFRGFWIQFFQILCMVSYYFFKNNKYVEGMALTLLFALPWVLGIVIGHLLRKWAIKMNIKGVLVFSAGFALCPFVIYIGFIEFLSDVFA